MLMTLSSLSVAHLGVCAHCQRASANPAQLLYLEGMNFRP